MAATAAATAVRSLPPAVAARAPRRLAGGSCGAMGAATGSRRVAVRRTHLQQRVSAVAEAQRSMDRIYESSKLKYK